MIRRPEGEASAADVADQEAVRLVVGRFSRQLEPTAKLMVGRYCDTIADYRLADADFLDRDVYLVSLDALRVTVGDLEHGRQGVADEFSGVRAGAARRVHQDVALESFLHAVRLWGKVLWESVTSSTRADVAEERGAALTIAGRILEHIDLVSVAATWRSSRRYGATARSSGVTCSTPSSPATAIPSRYAGSPARCGCG